jgi:hypothetical protein
VRWATPVLHFRRTARPSDYELGGKQIKKGDKVVMWHISGQPRRDAPVFDEPFTFDIERVVPQRARRLRRRRTALLPRTPTWRAIIDGAAALIFAPGDRQPHARHGASCRRTAGRVPALELHRRHQAHAGALHPVPATRTRVERDRARSASMHGGELSAGSSGSRSRPPASPARRGRSSMPSARDQGSRTARGHTMKPKSIGRGS